MNLQLNIGADDGESGYLNDWAEEMFDLGHEVFVSSDNMFANALLGEGLDPKSDNNFSLYTYETAQSRSEVGSYSRLRSEVNRKIEREHPESLLPSVPTKNFVACDNHMFCRLTEHLLVLRVMSCLNEEVDKDQKDGTLTNLIANINYRGVRGGTFQVKFDGPKLEPITLNVTHAETISAPPDAFDTEFSHILDGVVSDRTFSKKRTPPLQAALKWPTDTISTYDLEKAIWDAHWKLHILARKDPDPRKDPNRLKPEAGKDRQMLGTTISA